MTFRRLLTALPIASMLMLCIGCPQTNNGRSTDQPSGHPLIRKLEGPRQETLQGAEELGNRGVRDAVQEAIRRVRAADSSAEGDFAFGLSRERVECRPWAANRSARALTNPLSAETMFACRFRKG